MATDTLRKAELSSLVATLRGQNERKLDVIAPARDVWSRNGNLYLRGAEQEITADGVTSVDREYVPTRVFDETLATKLNIPLAYLRRMRDNGWTDMIDGNVNGLLHGYRTGDGYGTQVREPEDRSFMIRAYKGADGEPGVARAVLSDRYKTVDNYDVLMSALAGMQEAGLDAGVIDSADLTDRRMYVRVVAHQIRALAPALLKGYRSPFTGKSAEESPVVFAGFVISNSEVGGGAFTVTPRLVIEACTNGLTVTADAQRAVHIGGKLDAGIIRYSDDTQEKNLALIKARTRDTVKTFLDVEYVKAAIARLEETAGIPVEKPADHIKTVAKTLAYDQETADGILDHFIKGGQMTRGGVMQAVTSYAQLVEDADKASDLEASATKVLAISGK